MKLYTRRGRRSSPLWLVIFSDLSTNLMLFFLMAFAMTRMTTAQRDQLVEGMEKAMKSEQAIKARQERKKKEATAIQTLKDTVAYGRLKQYTKVEVTDKNIKLTIDLPFFFQSGSAEIDRRAIPALESLVRPLKEFPNDVIIEGHTDNVPIHGGQYRSNWELSVARAVSVINFLTAKGINPKKLVAGGYGEYHPAFPNDTPEHRARNRRIEITIVRQPGV
jgi:chemotaxis protein MotB